MLKTITINAYNRPGALRRLLRSLNSQTRDLNSWRLHIVVDGGGSRQDEVVQVIRSSGLRVPCEMEVLEENVGINEATLRATSSVYDHLGADFNLYLEDDLVLSPDAIALCDWFVEDVFDQSIAALCLFNRNPKKSERDPELVVTERKFTGWGFVMSNRAWQLYAKPVWTSGKSMWDNRIANNIRRQSKSMCNAFPDLSRVTNIGRTGAHFSADKFDQFMEGHVYSREAHEFSYHF